MYICKSDWDPHKIDFDGASESWPIFCIEMTGILIKYGLLQFLSLASVRGKSITPIPTHLYFQSVWLEAVLKLALNISLLRWPMHEGDKYGVNLWSWLKVRYESAANLDPLRQFYGDNIRLLKLKSGGSLGDYIERFQGLAILWQEIDTNVELGYRLITQMVEKIEYPLLSVPCKSIKNWYQTKSMFCDTAATLRAHGISKMTAQT